MCAADLVVVLAASIVPRIVARLENPFCKLLTQKFHPVPL